MSAYASTIHFTFDTICPWTYLAYTRLRRALARLTPADHALVAFTWHLHPYQLHAETPPTGTDKADWYTRTVFAGDAARWAAYQSAMRALGEPVDIEFAFGGETAGTFEAHRVLQAVQAADGDEAAQRVLRALYCMYFEEERHPSSRETLQEACERAGVDKAAARALVDDEDAGRAECRAAVREQEINGTSGLVVLEVAASDEQGLASGADDSEERMRREHQLTRPSAGVDAVPIITIEGKRRDVTLQGAKEIDEYEKALRQVIKEAQ